MIDLMRVNFECINNTLNLLLNNGLAFHDTHYGVLHSVNESFTRVQALANNRLQGKPVTV